MLDGGRTFFYEPELHRLRGALMLREPQGDPGVGVDSQSGAAFVAGNLLDEDGVMVLPIAPAGARVTIPNSGAEQLQHPVGITGRIGKPGVFVAYTQGTNEFLGKPAIYRVDTGKSIRLSNKKGGEDVCVAAAPGGRLWAFWKDGDTIFATRSNTSATKFGQIVDVRALGKGTTIYELNGLQFLTIRRYLSLVFATLVALLLVLAIWS